PRGLPPVDGADQAGRAGVTGRHPPAALADAPAQARPGRLRPARRPERPAMTQGPVMTQRPVMSQGPAMNQRWELLRALGAVADSPAAARAVAAALGLDPVSDDEHTEAFVLNCPPYAAVYLGPDGALGGEGADRAAGFWRALGLTPPA